MSSETTAIHVVAIDNGVIRLSTALSPAPSFPLSQCPPSILDRVEATQTWSEIEDLWADGIVEQIDTRSWAIRSSCIYDVPPSSLDMLGISAEPELRISTETSGIPGRQRVQARVEVNEPTHGRLEGLVERCGPFYLPHGSRPILIPEAAFELLRLADRGPSGESADQAFAFLAHIKRLSLACGATISLYLEREEYYFPQSVEVLPDVRSPREVDLKVGLRGGASEKDLTLQRTQGPARPTETVPGQGGQRRRVVLSQELREQIDAIHDRAVVTGTDVPRFAQNPEAYLPPGIDLSDFSERVKGLRSIIYNSRPYLHVRKSEGGWFEGIPGIELDPGLEQDGESPGSSEDLDAGELSSAAELSPETYEELQRRARETGDEWVEHEGRWIRIDRDRAESFSGTLGRFERTADGAFRAPASAILDIYENLDALEFKLPPLESLGFSEFQRELPTVELAPTFCGELRIFQSQGFRWLAGLDRRSSGGLLADDMGLGKTVQVVAHLSRLALEDRLRPALIVCPKSLLENWQHELQRFFPAHGPLLIMARPTTAQHLEEFNLVLVSYDTLRRNQLEIAKVNWELVVADEAQYAKNPTAQRTTALKALKARHRVALTGTPVENGLIEFWCILDWVKPGLLGSWKDFRTEYERPLVQAASEEERAPLVKQLLEERLGIHYLRRLKKQELSELPQRCDEGYEVPLSDAQMAQYREIATSAHVGGRGAALAALSKLLRISGHPRALDEGPVSGYQQGECPKLDKTLDVLREIRERAEKAIVFTRFKRLQRILQSAIRETFGIHPDIVNGDMTENRKLVIDIFSEKEGFNVLILSEEVGGVGLNIIAANHVIHYTRPWNPAKENQASDRVHRFGQQRPVTVHYPIARHDDFTTVEERLDQLLKAKADLARDVLRPSSETKVRPEELLSVVAVAATTANQKPLASHGWS